MATLALSHDTQSLIEQFDATAQERRDRAQERHDARIDRLASVIRGKRDEAIKARIASGIEENWRQSEEKYAGIDDANREMKGGGQNWQKSSSLNGSVTTSEPNRSRGKRSIVYPRLSARYTDATVAKFSEVVISPRDKSFGIRPTPVPDLEALLNNQTAVAVNGQPLQKFAPPPAASVPPAMPTQSPPDGQAASDASGQSAPSPPTAPLTVKDLAEEYMAKARERASLAEQRIYDWLAEAKFKAHARRVVFDIVRLGVGVMKGPYPQSYRTRRVNREDLQGGMAKLTIEDKDEVRPTVSRVNPWNFFPDGACGDRPSNGDYVFERVYLSRKQVKALEKQEGYLPRMVRKALKDGPISASKNTTTAPYDGSVESANQFEGWYFYGVLTADDLAAINPEIAKAHFEGRKPKPDEEVPVIATLIGDTLVHATINPLASGAFPYHAVPYIYREGSWAGESLPERLDVPERILVAATRAMMNNAGISSGSQIIIDKDGLAPENGDYTVTPDKIWARKNSAISEDVRKLFMAVEIPNRTAELQRVIDYAFRLAEESSNLPLTTQGFAGKDAPENQGASQVPNSNASQMLREMAYNYDDYLTAPMIDQFYEWLLLDPDVPEQEKGDDEIQAYGSTALVERALQDQFILTVAQMVMANPVAFGADAKRIFKQILKSRGLDPAEFSMTADELANVPPPQPPPQVLAAQIREQGATQREQAKLALEAQRDQADQALERELAQLEAEIEQQKVLALQEATRATSEIKLKELDLKKQIFVARYANDRQLSLENAKAQLAITAMKVKLQRELSLLKAGGEILNPPAEPPGKAKEGQSFIA